MAVERSHFVQERFASKPEFGRVSEIADSLLAYLRQPDVQVGIRTANRPGASSGEIQAVLLPFARSVGFRDESKGLFKSAALRPDYYLRLGNSGVLLEVERGKTIINNMDLLDFWKCHVCPVAHYLFLLVPQELVQREGGRVANNYKAVLRRLAMFYAPGNYTNVRGLFVFGY